ncbi:PAS domain S-box protein [Rhodospira trueperi]|uniref:Sensory/regulatory protein RpfC n=1 Tax=Rhodospira trueperi TaxID=69960 RepID=A0A1G6XP77_9PROT|nr:PAS domain S-box protein [Rhodospira trueperi]SDD80004.1 PAS domain S-box-containing protein [Rhodospira trueperi]
MSSASANGSGTEPDAAEQDAAHTAITPCSGAGPSQDETLQLLDGLADAVFIHDLQGRLCAFNDTACTSLGYDRAELAGMSVADFETTVSAEQISAGCEKAKASGVTLAHNGVHRRKDGTLVPVEMRTRAIVRDDRDLVVTVARDISDRQQTEQILRDSEQRLRALIERSPFGIAVTLADGQVLMANQRLAQLLGQDLAALQAKNFNYIYVDPQDSARLKELYAVRGRVIEHEVRLLTRADDKMREIPHWFQVSWQPTRFEGQDAIVSWYQDVNHRHQVREEMADLHAELQYRIEERTRELGVEITERRYAEAALKEANDFLEQKVEERTQYLKREIEHRRRAEKDREKTEMELLDIIETAPIAVGIADEYGRFLFWNPLFFKIGRQQMDGNGKINFGLDFENPELMRSLQTRVVAGEAVEHVEAKLTSGETDHRWVLISMRRLNFEGQAAILTWVFDITDMKDQAQALDEAREAAEASARAKSTFLATMSHEIRTPMNGVLTMAEMLAQTRMDPDQRHMLEVVTESANALLNIIDEILDFSKIEAGHITLEAVSVSLTQVTERVADLVAPKAASKGLDLICRASMDMHDHYSGDPHRLRQILVNLAGNAIKFTERGHVSITVTLADGDAQHPADLEAPHLIRFEVSDTGIGMTEDQMSGLFQPFSQADNSTQRRFGGTGLGLSICRTLVELMDGRIGVESVAGKGSTFWFEVPLRPLAERRELSPPPIDGARIIIASDSPSVREHVTGILEWAGAEAISAPDSDAVKSALMFALVRERPVHAIILDRRVEGEPGTRLLDDILRIGAPSPPRVLVVVPRGSSETSRLAQRDGVSAVLGWPLHGYDIAHTLAIALGRLSAESLSPHRRRHADRPVGGGTGRYIAPERPLAEVEECVVLVAEDNPTNRTVIRMLLDRIGVVCDLTENGLEALALFETRCYGLVITDCHMPEMDGYELTGHIRQLETEGEDRPRTPIIALTADAIAGTAQDCLDRGMDDYLTKPVVVADLEAVIRRWLPRALEIRRATPVGLLTPDALSPPRGETKADATPSPQPPPNVEDNAPTAPTAEDKAAAALAGTIAPEEAPVLDPSYMLDLVGGDMTMLQGLLEEFLVCTKVDLDETLAALNEGRHDAARKAAHTVSGASRSAGALRLGALSKQIEQALFHGDTETPKTLQDQLIPAFEEAEAAIRALDG